MMFQYFKKHDKANNCILVVGGGDGYLTEHLLRVHDDALASIVVVELDAEVVRMVNRHFRNGADVFAGQRKVTLVHDSGEKFLKETTDVFDGIIIDCSDFDPNFPSSALFTPEFYGDAISKLGALGYMTQQYGPLMKPPALNANVFDASTSCFQQLYCPSYGVPIRVLHYWK